MWQKTLAGLVLWCFAYAAPAACAPKLLLTAQRLRRLKRDCERKTARWLNFENRVNAVPDSEERGFELALYYAITGDESKGREAIQWALTHNSARQRALVVDWCAPLLSEDQKKKLLLFHFIVNGQATFQLARDSWFNQIASGREVSLPDGYLREQLAALAQGEYRNAQELYDACELIYAVRESTRRDLRETDAHFFANLPALLLLSAKPGELNSPPWQKHAAALALVETDPNLPASQFLQSWALEDSQTLREGPGVAYELLWADPYLPGVGYQNMDPWLYDEHGRLFARESWDATSCWIAISPAGVEQQNCPPGWQNQAVAFGRLTLIPLTARCVEIPRVAGNESVLVWKVAPGQKVAYGKGKEQRDSEADAGGLWRPGSNVEGRACLAAH